GQPWNTDAGHTSMAGIGLGDVEAIGVVIAVIDPAGRALVDAVSPDRMFDLISDLADFQSAPGRGFGNQQKYVGGLESAWETTVATVASTASAMDLVIGDFQREIANGSSPTPSPLPTTSPMPIPTATPFVYPLSTPANIVPMRNPTSTPGTTPAIPNRIRSSVRSDSIA